MTPLLQDSLGPCPICGQLRGWRSMASAPLYERILLLYRARDLIVCGRWEEDKWRSRSAPKPFWTNDKLTTIGITRLRAEPPDGWMPLPEAQK